MVLKIISDTILSIFQEGIMKKLLIFLSLLLFCTPVLAAPPLGNPIVSIQTATASGSLIAKATSGWLNGFDATAGGTDGYVLIFDSATVPTDGTVTPKFCYNLPKNTTTGATWLSYPTPFTNGIVMVFSSTGCFTKTISNTAFFSAQIQ